MSGFVWEDSKRIIKGGFGCFKLAWAGLAGGKVCLRVGLVWPGLTMDLGLV